MKDISNIFNLSPNELEKKSKSTRSLWSDTAPQIVEFAQKLSKFIIKSDTPYVLALDGGYGTGKTHFSSRFSILLDKRLRTIYFSAWEQDYMVDPFVVFSEKIIWIARKQANETEITDKILESLAKATKIRAEFGIWGLFKVEAELSGEDLIKKLFPEKQRSDLFIELKVLLSNFIQNLPNKKLVMIVDELDRCRPDYAVKILETIKHFFDIPGLIFILPINSKKLNTYVKGFYNIPNDTFADGEDYLQKFINETIDVPQLNYNKICEDRIKLADFGHHISNIEGNFNSIQELKKWIAEYAKQAHLSYRETIEIIKRAKYFCKNYSEEIRCRLLAYQLCNKLYKQKNKNSSNPATRASTLKFEKNYMYKEGYEESQKEILLKADLFNAHTRLEFPGHATTSNVQNICHNISSLQQNAYSYKIMFSTIEKIKNELNKIDIEHYVPYQSYWSTVTKAQLREKVQCIQNYLNQAKQNLSNFQQITGSDDSDDERLSRYEEKIKNPTSLFK